MPSEQRAALVQTPVGAELLTFTHLVGRDEISRCLAYTVGFVSTNADIDPLKMLGGVVSIEGESDPKRWFSGLIAEFRLTRIEDRMAYYEAVSGRGYGSSATPPTAAFSRTRPPSRSSRRSSPNMAASPSSRSACRGRIRRANTACSTMRATSISCSGCSSTKA